MGNKFKCEKCGNVFDDEGEAIKHEKRCKPFDPKTQVQEYKRKCLSCGKVWHSLVSREKQIESQNKCDACIQGATACNGDLGTASQTQRNREAKEHILSDLKKCPSCGSQNYREETITYDKK